MKLELLKAIPSWVFWAFVRLNAVILGFFVVAAALPFRTEEPVPVGEEKPYPERKIVHLPKWAWLWDNDAEGMMSWMEEWPEMCWNGKPDSFLSMWQWAAWRNPANNMRFMRGIAVYLPEAHSVKYWGKYKVSDKDYKNGEGWQFVGCKGKYFPYYGFQWVGKKYYIRLGHKIEPNHFEPDYLPNSPERKHWKGMTFRPLQKRRDNSKYEINK